MKNLSDFANQVLDSCNSTNDVAKKLAESSYPHGTWVSTKNQLAGRGRMGRQWESQEGNLFLSVIIRIPNRDLWSWVPLTAAVSIVQCLQKYSSELDLKIKWPNDIWLNGAKLGGILCESSGSHSNSHIIIGIGLNCKKSPQNLDIKTACLSPYFSDVAVENLADQLRPLIVDSLLRNIAKLAEEGPKDIVRIYEKWALLREGNEIEWGQDPINRGTVAGLGPTGELRVHQEGKFISLFAEDVRIRQIK